MKALAIALAIAAVGCGDKFETITGTDSLPVASLQEPAPSCSPFDISWLDETDEGAIITITTTTIGVIEVEIEERSGNPWQHIATSTTFGGHFDTTYRVKGKVKGCWSEWFEFTSGSPNSNNNHEQAQPVVPTRELWSWSKCIKAEVLYPGISEVLYPDAPAGKTYNVEAIAYENGHPRQGQAGQDEVAIIGNFGLTLDVPDNEKASSKSWTTSLPIPQVRVSGGRGSLHSEGLGHGAVCVFIDEVE